MPVLTRRGTEALVAAEVLLRLQAPTGQGPRRAYIPHCPHPQQAVFLSLDVLEAFYGGAAGGGKSDALLMDALKYVHVPGYAALIVRRTYADLAKPGALIPRSHEWLSGTDAQWDGSLKQWRFPSGAVLAFGYLEGAHDIYRYQSSEFQFIGFDELTQHLESQYTYLFSRLRRLAASDVPLRMRSASNPGGRGHEWVSERFVPEDYVASQDVRREVIYKGGRAFVPAVLEDNPSLDVEEYDRALAELDPVTRAQLRHGDWTARSLSGYFQRTAFEIIPVEPAGLDWVRFWDIAATEPTAGNDPDYLSGAKVAIDSDGFIILGDMARLRGTPQDVERLIKQTAALDGQTVEIYMEQEPGASGKALIDHYTRHVLPGYSVRTLIAATRGSKIALASPLSAQAASGNVKLVNGPWIKAFLDEAELFPNGAHDDQVDAASSAYYVLTGSAWLERRKRRRVANDMLASMGRMTPPCASCGNPVYRIGPGPHFCAYCGKEYQSDVLAPP